jgi:hypothetical protein
MVLRRQFLGTVAGLTITQNLAKQLFAGTPGVPVPIPHTTPTPFGAFHFFFPGPVEGVDPNTGHDPSTIYNFNGFLGEADLDLSGTGTDTTTNVSAPYTFHTDMRFMSGVFVGTDGGVHRGAFAFI